MAEILDRMEQDDDGTTSLPERRKKRRLEDDPEDFSTIPADAEQNPMAPAKKHKRNQEMAVPPPAMPIPTPLPLQPVLPQQVPPSRQAKSPNSIEPEIPRSSRTRPSQPQAVPRNTYQPQPQAAPCNTYQPQPQAKSFNLIEAEIPRSSWTQPQAGPRNFSVEKDLNWEDEWRNNQDDQASPDHYDSRDGYSDHDDQDNNEPYFPESQNPMSDDIYASPNRSEPERIRRLSQSPHLDPKGCFRLLTNLFT
jgi:hypothetical protein